MFESIQFSNSAELQFAGSAGVLAEYAVELAQPAGEFAQYAVELAEHTVEPAGNSGPGKAAGSRRCLQVGFAIALAFGVACATMPHGATEANLAHGRSEAADGWAAFRQHCASCHGERGESVASAPRVLGEGALPEFPRELNINADPAAGDPELARMRVRSRPAGAPRRDPFRSAQDLYSYVSKKMPAGKGAGSLSAGQYWNIINFMLLAHGVQVPPGGVNEGNASSVKLEAAHP
jgi:hypothetical protein